MFVTMLFILSTTVNSKYYFKAINLIVQNTIKRVKQWLHVCFSESKALVLVTAV